MFRALPTHRLFARKQCQLQNAEVLHQTEDRYRDQERALTLEDRQCFLRAWLTSDVMALLTQHI